MPFQYTFRSDDITTWDAPTRDLLENRDRELELYLTAIDTSLLNLTGYLKLNNGDFTLTTNISDTPMTVSFYAISGRVYRATWSGSAQKLTTTGYTGIFATNSVNSVYGSVLATSDANDYVNISGSAIFDNLPTGFATIKLRGLTQNNTSTVLCSGNYPFILLVQDIGLVPTSPLLILDGLSDGILDINRLG